MIVNIRGANGSGKTTIVRSVMEQYICEPEYIDNRKRPFGYHCRADDRHPLWILGSYESAACGGCDTVPKIQDIFDSVSLKAEQGYHVLFEGILAQHSADRIIAVAKRFTTKILVLNLPIPECIEAVQQRRNAKGNSLVFDPKNLINEWKSMHTRGAKLKAAGVDIQFFETRNEVLFIVKSLLLL